VVLTGNDDLPGIQILHRMVRAVVAELHLQRLRSRGETHDLVAKADAEHRDARGVEDFADRLDGVVARLGIARAVGEKDPVRLHAKNFFCRRNSRNNRHARAAIRKHPQDVALDAEVEGDDVELRLLDLAVALAQLPATLAPLIGLFGADDLGQIHSAEAGKGPGLLQSLFNACVARGQATVLGALLAQDPGQLAGVEVGDANDFLSL
jgi:hypothetical protein